jgi:hypothetical protein
VHGYLETYSLNAQIKRLGHCGQHQQILLGMDADRFGAIGRVSV